MSKVISSPVLRFPGTVTLADPLTFPQSFAVEDAIAKVAACMTIDPETNQRVFAEGKSLLVLNYAEAAGILPCVEEWHIKGFPEHPTLNTLVTSPRLSSARVYDWLWGEVTSLYNEAEEIPFDSEKPSTPG